MNESNATRRSLIVRLQNAADDDAWSEFIDIYTPVVYRFLRRKGLQDADASDVSQDVLRSVATAIETFEHHQRSGSFRAWLLTVTQRRYVDFVQRSVRQAHGSGDTAHAEQIANIEVSSSDCEFVEQEYRQAVFDHLAKSVRAEVKEKTWLAFWLTQVEGRATADVAEELQVSIENIYVARSRVLAKLRERAQHYEI